MPEVPPASAWGWVNSPTTFAIAVLVVFALSVFYAITRGGLMPRRTYDATVAASTDTVDRLTSSWESRLEESQEREQAWRSAYQSAEAARSELSEQVGQLVVLARTTEALLRALPSGRG